jgi:4-hydroxy-tetrahydrodipicolinate synthase
MISKRLQGVGVALVTPFDAQFNIDFKHLEKLVQFINGQSIHYWVIHGTTGENPTTTASEKKAVLDCLVANNPQGLPIVYGLGGNNTQEILAKLTEIELQAIDAFLIVTPYYNKPSQQGLYAHYQAIADVSPLPIILYNVPSRTGVNLSEETTIALSKHPNIIGIKEASGNLEQCLAIVENASADFLVISGDDILTVPMMSIGAVGVISTLANAFPQHLCKMIQAVINNDYITARKYQARLLNIHRVIAKEGNPVATKQILEILDLSRRYVRLPLVPCSAEARRRVNQIITSLKLL